MKNILVLGGGFAGVWSAAGAVRLGREVGSDELRVRLISAGDDMVVLVDDAELEQRKDRRFQKGQKG